MIGFAIVSEKLIAYIYRAVLLSLYIYYVIEMVTLNYTYGSVVK
jgi:hypothetical protein